MFTKAQLSLRTLPKRSFRILLETELDGLQNNTGEREIFNVLSFYSILQRPVTLIKQDHLDIDHDFGVEVLPLPNLGLITHGQIMIDTPAGLVKTNS